VKPRKLSAALQRWRWVYMHAKEKDVNYWAEWIRLPEEGKRLIEWANIEVATLPAATWTWDIDVAISIAMSEEALTSDPRQA